MTALRCPRASGRPGSRPGVPSGRVGARTSRNSRTSPLRVLYPPVPSPLRDGGPGSFGRTPPKVPAPLDHSRLVCGSPSRAFDSPVGRPARMHAFPSCLQRLAPGGFSLPGRPPWSQQQQQQRLAPGGPGTPSPAEPPAPVTAAIAQAAAAAAAAAFSG
jgi:hypothetical protein